MLLISFLGSLGRQVIDWVGKTSNSTSRFFKICLLILLFLFIAIPFSMLLGCFSLKIPKVYATFFFLCFILPLILLVLSSILVFTGNYLPLHLKEVNLKILNQSWNLLVVYFIIALSILFFSSNGIHFFSQSISSKFLNEQIRLPMSSLTGVAIDKDNYLYIASRTYGRVQKYTQDGSFVKGWFVNTNGAFFNIWIDDKDFLHAIIARGGGHMIFDLDGNLISDEAISVEESRRLFRFAKDLIVSDNFGNIYNIKTKGLSTIITKTILASSKQITVIEDKFYLWLLQTQQICLFCGLGLLACFISFIIKSWCNI